MTETGGVGVVDRIDIGDRDRVTQLVQTELDRRFNDTNGTYQEQEARQIPFRRKLYQEGAAAVPHLLASINTRFDRHVVYDAVEICAREENADELLDFMVDNKRRRVDEISNVLQRLANASHIPQLQEYMTDCADEDEYLHRAEQVVSIALAASQREKDLKKRKELLDFVDGIAEPDADNPVISKEELDTITRETDPGLLNLRFAELFYTEEPDPDLDYIASDDRPELEGTRLEGLSNLYSLTENQVDMSKAGANAQGVLEKLTYKEQSSPYVVTVGVEIEIEKRSLPHFDSNADVDTNAHNAVNKLTNIHRVAAAGLPTAPESGLDIVKEYATLPAYHYATISREVQQAMAMDVISPGYTEHPLHITIGNITSEGPKGQGAYVLARAMEATGWSCSSDRLKRPLGEVGSWTYRGKAGVKERQLDEITGTASSAVEFRTFSVQSLGGLDRTLRTAQLLGSALSAYQLEGGRDETQERLASVWEHFSEKVSSLFQSYGMDEPSESWNAKAINEDNDSELKADLSPNFLKLADLLAEAKSSSESAGGQFQQQLQQVIIEARGEIADLVKH
jgi:hypothetical protein